jgi:hypothetical protein
MLADSCDRTLVFCRALVLGLCPAVTLGILLSALPATAAPGFAFLQLGAGARAAALGEATTALVDPQASSANPAALVTGRSAAFSHTEWVRDIRHEHAASTWGGEGGTYAFDVLLSHAGDLERRVGPTSQSLGEFGVYEWTAGIAWARPLSERLRAGISAKFARQSIDAESASGGAVDVGLHYGAGPWWIGAAARNLGRMSDLDREATDLPLQLRLGGATVRGPLLLSSDLHWTRDVDTSVHMGAEFRVRPRLLLRAGYQSADTRDMSLGLGVFTGAWRVDYAYVPFGDGLGQAHRVSLVWSEDRPL